MNKKVKLLIITQKVDENDDILGFFHSWIEEFAKHCEQVTVICLYEGQHHLPKNVKVLSLGKEKYFRERSMRKSERCDLEEERSDGLSVCPRAERLVTNSSAGRRSRVVKRSFLARLQYIYRFYRYIWQERKNYDSVFVHMNQIYIILGGILWRMLGKKIGLWYAHGHVSTSLRIAERFSDIIFTSTASGFRMKSKKARIVGQGIDTSLFKPNEVEKKDDIFRIISIGRISPIKDYETLINAVELVHQKGIKIEVNVIGSAGLLEQEKYLDDLKIIVNNKKLGDVISFKGGVANKDIVDLLQQSDLYINTSHTGSLDKAILEAMSVGLPILSCNEALSQILVGYRSKLMFSKKDFKKLAEKIEGIISMKNTERILLGRNLREIVKKDHNIGNFVKTIIKEF